MSGVCTPCQTNAMFCTQTSIIACNFGYYLQNNTCNKCGNYAVYCLNNVTALFCAPGFVMAKNATCVFCGAGC